MRKNTTFLVLVVVILFLIVLLKVLYSNFPILMPFEISDVELAIFVTNIAILVAVMKDNL